ncbi:Na+/H+ antiporter subunit E [bacterium]|nr:Na+/H+ antiporter subunit E [bacterium]
MKVSKFLFSFIVFFIIWMGLTMPFNIQEVIIGAIVSIFVSLLAVSHISTGLDALYPWRLLILLGYVPYFIYKMFEANIQLALIVINPKLPIKPAILKGKTTLKKNASKIWLANSITLTPGTLTVDVKEGDFYIHCVKPKEETSEWLEKEVLHPFEGFLKGGIDGK